MVVWNKVSFFVNIFPSTSHDWENIKCEVDGKMLYVRHLFEFHSSLSIIPKPKYWCFKTDKIFMNCCQSEIYAIVMDQIIDKTTVGVDTVLLGYGQNQSGKTYTITGLQNQFHFRGMVPRFIFDLMKQKKNRENDLVTNIWISVVDIFKNSLYDLLRKSRPKCKDETVVRKVRIKSEMHCLELLFKAEAARMTVGRTNYIAHSATNIVTFFVKTVPLNSQETFNKLSKVHFVDLAGVETIDRSPATSVKDKETQGDANVTKTMLEMFALQSHSKRSVESIGVVMQNSSTHIVTKYLGRALSLSSNLKLICHIRPNRKDLSVTLSLLRFGMSFLNVKMLNLQSNVEINEEQVGKKLKEEVKLLKDDILLKQMCKHAGKIDISQERIDFIKRSVILYLNDELSEPELLSLVDDCSLVLKIIKDISKENFSYNDNLSIGLQTEVVDEYKTSRTEEKDNILDINNKMMSFKSENKKISIPEEKQDIDANNNNTSKHKNTETKSKKSQKTVTGKKGAKTAEKPVLKEAEVQVNLVEPKAKLPSLDSREGHWALFLTSNPEVQVLTDKLGLLISRKEKAYSEQVIRHEATLRSLGKTQLELNRLASFRHTELMETYNYEGQIVIPEEESKLAKQLSDLREESFITKQKLIDCQTEWLDSLEKMNCEKQLLESKFKAFCIQNNLFAITQEVAAQQNISENFISHTSQIELPAEESKSYLNELVDLGPRTPYINDFEDIYVALQTKYLKR